MNVQAYKVDLSRKHCQLFTMLIGHTYEYSYFANSEGFHEIFLIYQLTSCSIHDGNAIFHVLEW